MKGKLRFHPHRINAFMDPVYDSFLFSKFINFFIKKGRKVKVQNLFYNIMAHELFEKYLPYFVFFEILEKFKPRVGIVLVRKRGVLHTIPVPIKPQKKYKMALTYLYTYILRNREGPTFTLNIGNQFRQMFFSRRLVIAELENNRRQAVAGRVFSHYRWK